MAPLSEDPIASEQPLAPPLPGLEVPTTGLPEKPPVSNAELQEWSAKGCFSDIVGELSLGFRCLADLTIDLTLGTGWDCPVAHLGSWE